MIKNKNKLLVYIFIIITVLLLGLSARTYLRVISISGTASEFQAHTRKLNNILQLFYTFKDIESATRGYFLMGDSLYLGIRERSMTSYPLLLQRIESQLNHQSVSGYYFSKLSDIYQSRISYLNSLMTHGKTGDEKQLFADSPQVIESARLLTDKLVLEENKHLHKLELELRKDLDIAPDAVLILAVIFIGILLLAYLSLSRQLRLSRKLANNLEESNLSLEVANKSLAQSRAFLQAVIDSSPDGILTYEAIRDEQGAIEDFRILFGNRNLAVLQGRDPETILYKKASEVYPNIQSTGLFQQLKSVTNTGKSTSFELFYPYDGKVGGWFEVYISRFNDGVTLTGRDINHIKRNQEELQKNITLLNSYVQELKIANEQLKQFNFVASHDLQEPLRKIQFFSNKMLEKTAENPLLSTDLNKIRSSAARMSDLIMALTKYSRLQLGAISLQLVDLNQILKQVLSDLENQINEKNAVLEADTFPSISCDPVQISQLFLQLLSNSLKFCTKTPQISITCMMVDDPIIIESLNNNFKYIRLRFVDNGIGFNSEYNDKIFMIFQKLHNTKNYSGTGVGLALCKKIAENHKGKISAYSIENEGSTFDVYLPVNLMLETN